MNKIERFQLKKNIIASLNQKLPEGSAILDLGCGAGDLVRVMREEGYHGFGCDVAFKKGPYVEKLTASGYLRKISPPEYRLPFEDASFDFVTSDQVFEHIQDHELTLSEIYRVLKPGGISLHIYPPPAILVEPHVFVPFGGLIQSRIWLLLWAFLGIKTKAQRGKSAQEVSKQNFDYLKNKTNYVSMSRLENIMKTVGFDFAYVEKDMLCNYSGRTKRFMMFNRILPVFPWFCRNFISRALFVHKK